MDQGKQHGLVQGAAFVFQGKEGIHEGEQLDKYRRDSGRSSLTDAAAIEEILADEFMSVSKRVPMLREMAGEKPTLAQRFVVQHQVERIYRALIR